MINTSDPLELLRAANPVPAGSPTLPRPDPLLFRRIVTGETTGRAGPRLRPVRSRRARRLVPAFLVASLLGGAVAYALLRGEVSIPNTVACYERADLEARTEVVRVDNRGPRAACADLWQRGILGPGGAVPALAECVLDAGVAGVFPTSSGQDVCARLALAAVPSTAPPPSPSTVPPGGPAPGPPPTQAEVNARFLAFRDAVLPQFLEARCVEPRAGAAIVRRELAAAGLADWTVVGGDGLPSDGFTAERPCATLSFHPERREIVLVPTPARP